MSKTVQSFDMAAFKFGACRGRWPEREVSAPLRFAVPEVFNFQPLSQDERAWKTLLNALSIIQRDRPDVVLLEDCTIQFVTKDAKGKTIFKSKGSQDYYVKRNIGVLEFYCKFIAKPAIEVILVAIPTMNSVCGTSGQSKKQVQDLMTYRYGVLCPTEDHGDAVKLLDYYFLTH